MTNPVVEHHVIVVGGGPAGAACALALRRAGVDCLILDAAAFPRHKACAGWVTPEAFAAIGAHPSEYPHGLVELHTIHYHVGPLHIPLPVRQYSVRRVEFDNWMLGRSGVECIPHRVRRIEVVRDGYVLDGRFRCRILVGAGGTSCPVRRTLFPERSRDARRLIAAVEAEFKAPVAMNECHLWFFDGGVDGYSWVIPKAGGWVNVGVGGRMTTLRAKGQSIRSYFGRVAGHLQAWGIPIETVPTPRGAAYYLRGNEVLRRGNAFLVGDSARLATKDMGEGIGPALRSGILAARSISTGEPYCPEGIAAFSLPSIVRSGLSRWLRSTH